MILCSLMKVPVFLPLMLFKYSLHLHLTSGLPLNHFKQSFRCKSSLFYSLTLTNCLLRGLKMNAQMEWSVEMIDMFLVHCWSSRPHPPSTINCADGGCTFALNQNQKHDVYSVGLARLDCIPTWSACVWLLYNVSSLKGSEVNKWWIACSSIQSTWVTSSFLAYNAI